MRMARATMPNAQVAIITLDQSAEDEVGSGSWRGTRALNPALLTLTDGAADSQSGPTRVCAYSRLTAEET